MMPTHGIIEGPKIGPQLTLLKLVINPQDQQMLLLIHHLLTSKLKLVRKPQMLHISLHISHHHHKLNCKHIVMRQMNLCKCDWMCYKMAWVVVITGQPTYLPVKCTGCR